MSNLMYQFAIRSGGKAGRRKNKTSTIQVVEKLDGGYLILRRFRFIVGDILSLTHAKNRAKKFIREKENSE